MLSLRKKRHMPWHAIPFIRILPPFVTGIITGYCRTFRKDLLLGMILVTILLLLLFEMKRTGNWLLRSRMQGAFLYFLLFFVGSFCTTVKSGNRFQSVAMDEHQVFAAMVKEPPAGKKKWKSTTLEIESMECKGKVIPLGIDVLAFFDSGLITSVQQGTRIRFQKPIKKMKGNGNPGAFNWNNYWARKNIHHQIHFLPSDQIEYSGTQKSNLQWVLSKTRTWVVNHLQKNIPDSITAGLAEALLIGHKDDLDRQMLRHYSDTGLMHVIAISGMHLGLIYFILMALLQFVPIPKKLAFARSLLIIPMLWIFSFLTGAGPSILRAAVMYSLMTLGKVFDKKTKSINGLLGSAFLLLSVSPNWIYDPGFQLSYSAVLSILLFYRSIQQLASFRWKILRLAWKLIAVTMSAQILTTPISILHFHQFPVYFLPANIVAVPLSSIVLIGELTLCGLFFSPLLSRFCGNLLHWIMHFMNAAIEHISNWPMAVWQPLHIDLSQVLLMYAILFSVSLGWMQRKKIGLQIAFIGMVFFLLIRLQAFYKASVQEKIVIYDVGRFSMLDILLGRKSVCLTNPEASKDERTERIKKSCHAIYRVDCDENKALHRNETLRIRINDICILTVGKKGVDPAHGAYEKYDLLWIREDAPPPGVDALKKMNFGQVVLDGSNTGRNAAKWKMACTRLNIPFHWVVEKGAFEMNVGLPTFAPSGKTLLNFHLSSIWTNVFKLHSSPYSIRTDWNPLSASSTNWASRSIQQGERNSTLNN